MDGGETWSLFALRLPSIAYTFATTALLAFFAYRMSEASNRLRTACVAAALYLLFFCTFRYGRVYLTSAPETFWLALPMWWVLWLRLRTSTIGGMHHAGATPGALAYTLFGIAMGLGAAYKSFALVAPAAAALVVRGAAEHALELAHGHSHDTRHGLEHADRSGHFCLVVRAGPGPGQRLAGVCGGRERGQDVQQHGLLASCPLRSLPHVDAAAGLPGQWWFAGPAGVGLLPAGLAPHRARCASRSA